MEKVDQILNLIRSVITESPDNYVDPDSDLDVFWDDGDTVTFGIVSSTLIYVDEDYVTHNELMFRAFYEKVGESEFRDEIEDFAYEVDGDEIEWSGNTTNFSKISDMTPLGYVGNWRPTHMGDRSGFDINGRIWKEHKVLSTWEGNVHDFKNNIKSMKIMFSDLGMNIEDFIFEFGDSDPITYSEIVFQDNVNNLKSKVHTMNIPSKWKRGIRNL